ncbi:MAG: MFS transporter [Chloroflexota bacterium]|nr:MFS transporter [Chloroflexota bacterium]
MIRSLNQAMRDITLERMFQSLKYRDFRLLWLGQGAHAAALWIEMVARPWLVLEITDGDATMVGLMVATRAAPSLLFGLFAGVLSDRLNRKYLLLAAKSSAFVISLAFVVLLALGYMELWVIFMFTFLRGTAMAFDQPARQSLVSQVVPVTIITNSVALMSSTQSVMRIAGVLVSGLVIELLGFTYAFGLVAFIYSGAVIATALIKADTANKSNKRTAVSPGAIMTELAEGLRYGFQNPTIRGIVVMSLIFYAFAMSYMQVFIPLIAWQQLDLGARGVSYLAAATGIGALFATFSIAAMYPKRLGIILILSLIGMGFALIAYSASALLPGNLGLIMPIILIGLVGIGQTGYFSISNATLLTAAPPEFRGRMVSLTSLDRSMSAVGGAMGGVLAGLFGAIAAQGLYGAIVIVAGLIFLVKSKGLRQYVAP